MEHQIGTIFKIWSERITYFMQWKINVYPLSDTPSVLIMITFSFEKRENIKTFFLFFVKLHSELADPTELQLVGVGVDFVFTCHTILRLPFSRLQRLTFSKIPHLPFSTIPRLPFCTIPLPRTLT